MFLPLIFMLYLRCLFLLLLFLPATARGRFRIDDAQHDAQQQDNTLTQALEVSTEAREALLPGRFGKALFPHQGQQAGPLRGASRRFEARRATVGMHATSGLQVDKVPPKELNRAFELEHGAREGGGGGRSHSGGVHMMAEVAAAAHPSPLGRCALGLAEAADRMVGAAAILGENQRQEEEPGALSAVGVSLANAARDLDLAGTALSVDGDWPSAAGFIYDAAQQLRVAATSMEGWGADEGMSVAAEELEDASSCTGCISLAVAAAPNLRAAGEALSSAADAVARRAIDLQQGSTSALQTAGTALGEAAVAMREAASGLEEAGERLEAGTAGPF